MQGNSRGDCRGLFTNFDIEAGIKVTSYSGQILDIPTTGRGQVSSETSAYYLSFGGGRVIDGFREPRRGFGLAQFANDPHGSGERTANCKFVNAVAGRGPGRSGSHGREVYLVTTRSIDAGM
jgi:hypothetical protein